MASITRTGLMRMPRGAGRKTMWNVVRRHPTAVFGALLLAAMVAMAVFAPLFGTVDPQKVSPIFRLREPSERFWFGTDLLGRDIYSRVVYGARVSLTVGIGVAIVATAAGLVIGLVTGFIRLADGIIMRFMDGLMSIPPVLLAIALMALTRASLENVIFAIALAEIPRVTRLVRGLVLSLREQPMVEAAIAAGSGLPSILFRHILPNTIAPLLVQGTYISRSREPPDAFPHARRHQPRGGRRLLPCRGRRDAGHRGRIRLRQVRHRHVHPAAHPRAAGQDRGRDPLQRPRPARVSRSARCARSAATRSA
jgi:ABC-type dipeptide/oligopeptide/nickel transport system permease subunit